MQTSLQNSFSVVGTGLHSGAAARLSVHPLVADKGIIFRRVDIRDRDNIIKADFNNVNETTLCTRVANSSGVEVSTVEHLMAALAGCGVHNALIDIDGPEIPIMDGSSTRFVQEILSAGVSRLTTPVKVLRILKEVSFVEGDVSASFSPSKGFEIDFTIDFDQQAIGVQKHSMDMRNGGFARELSNCRTFCRKEDVDNMKAAGLAKGGTLENAVVIDGENILNPEGFRRDDECVRHKMLDALGDLALSGMPIIGRYTGNRAGHRVTNMLLRKLFATPEAFEIVEASDTELANLPGVGLTIEEFAQAV